MPSADATYGPPTPRQWEALDYALKILGGEALHQWLGKVYWTTCQGGSSLCHMWPGGLNRSPADAGRCIKAAEEIGLIQWTGKFDSNPSMVAVKSLTYAKHPSKRPLYVEHEEKCWCPGPRADLLASLALSTWEEIQATAPYVRQSAPGK